MHSRRIHICFVLFFVAFLKISETSNLLTMQHPQNYAVILVVSMVAKSFPEQDETENFCIVPHIYY
jgi:hypothetical protein